MGDLPATATFLDEAIATSAAFVIATIVPTASPTLDILSSTDTLAGILATATVLAGGGEGGPHGKRPPNGECSLVGPFALVVQAALGGLALMALVFKRWRERPQRPLKIWSFDVSKQVFGSVLVHIANLLMSMLSSGQFSIKVDPTTIQSRGEDGKGHYVPNPCSFYLLNLAIDTTIGIPILIFLLRLLTALFRMTSFGTPSESIQSGNYGSPPKATWWFKQSIIYFLGLMGMKLCVLIIFLVLPWISRVGDWALRWTEGNEKLQVFFVMLFFPVIMNATQYYIIDSFIKNQKPSDHEPLATEDTEDVDGAARDGRPFDDPALGSSDEINSEDEEDTPEVKIQSKIVGQSRKLLGVKDRHDYDPRLDGESSPTVSGSSRSEREDLLGKGVQSESEDEAKPDKS